MNSISGIGSASPLAFSGLRSKDGFREEDLGALLPTLAPPAAPKADASYDHQSEQAYEEAFAKLRINLQSRTEGDALDSSVSSGTLSQSSVKEDSVVQAFREYMEMTPAEKIRDSILKEMGLSEEELDAMSPEQQKAVEEEIAERMQERAELQAAKEKEKEDKATNSATAAGSPDEQSILLS